MRRIAVWTGLVGWGLLGGVARGDPPAGGAPAGSIVVTVSARVEAAGKTAPPIAGAVVVASDGEGERARATTDARGAARLARLPDGDYTVRVDADRFVAEERDATVEDGREATLAFALQVGVAFDGTVVDDATGAPLADARVEVEAYGGSGGFMSSSSRPPYARATSDAQGKFHVNGVPEGAVATVEVAAAGHAAASFPLRVLGGQPTPAPVVVRMPPGGALGGVVRDPAGKPVAGATVYVFPASSEALRRNPRGWSMDGSGRREQAARVATDAEGRFLLDGLQFGVEYAALAETADGARSELAEGLRVDAKRPKATADLALRPPAGLVVRLVDLDGKPVTEPAKVEIGEVPSAQRKEAPDDANAYRFAGVDAGEWAVKVESPSFRDAWAKATVEPGKSTEIVVRLDPGASVSGVVVDEEGKPFADATVGVKAVGGEDPSPGGWTSVPILGRTATTDAQGRWTVKGLSPKKDADVDAWGTRGAEKDSYQTTAAVRVKPRVTDVRLVLVMRGTATLKVLRPDGTPYTGPTGMVWEGRKKSGSRSGSPSKIVDGTVAFRALDEADYEVQIDFADYLSIRREFHARLRTRLDLGTVTLDPGVAIPGRVVDLAGVPVPGARVSGNECTVATDANGAFRLPHEPRGKVRVSAEAEGFVEAHADAVASASMPPVEVRMPRGSLVRGVVKDATGASVQEDVFFWRIDAAGKRLDDDEEIVSPNEDGTFEHRVPAGRYRIVARAPERGGTPPPLGDFTLTEGETREVVLKLPGP